MQFRMNVGLGPGNIAFDADPALPPPPQEAEPTIFGPCLLWPNGKRSPSQLLLSTCTNSTAGMGTRRQWPRPRR